MAEITREQLNVAVLAAVAKIKAEYDVQLATDQLTIQRLRAEKENYYLSEVHKDIWRGTYSGRENTLDLSQVADPRGPRPALTKEQELEGVIALGLAPVTGN